MYGPVKNNFSLPAPAQPRARLLMPVGLAVVALLAAVGIATAGLDVLPVLVVLFGSLPLAYVLVAKPRLGLCALLILAYIIMFFTRLTSTFPVGTYMDGAVALLLFGFVLRTKWDKNWALFRNGITTILLIWIGYNFLQLANPLAASRLAWLYTIRPIAILALCYFLFVYYIRDAAFIRTLFKIWIGLSTVAALYTLVQEFHGFLPFEQEWLQSDPAYTSLYYIANHWRKFSIFSDPVAMAYNMVVSCILCIALATGPIGFWKKIVLLLLAALFFWAMLYSGTRGAFLLVPLAMVPYAVLRFNKKVMLGGAVLGVLAVGAIYMPTSNGTLYRFQTAFKPKGDASLNVRAVNQKRIQPYILSHPFGGGLGATGVWGKRFSPGTTLAAFPPDSGYVRVAVEAGWIGLLIFCTLIFVVLKAGINAYFRIKDAALKSYCLAALLIVFALNLGNFPQEALVQYPINIFFYLAVALIPVTLRLDRQSAAEQRTHGA